MLIVFFFFFSLFFPFSLLFCGGVCSREFFQRLLAEKKRRDKGAGARVARRRQKRLPLSRGIRGKEKSLRQRTALVWSGRGRALVGPARRSWINSFFFAPRESAFVEWLTPQRELFFETFSRSFSLSFSPRVLVAWWHRRSRGKREKAARVIFE